MAYSPLTQVKQVLDNIMDYVSRLWFIAEQRSAAWRILVDTVWTTTVSWSLTTITTVTTCWTVTNLTNIGWFTATNQIPALMNIEATLWNIDNITIS